MRQDTRQERASAFFAEHREEVIARMRRPSDPTNNMAARLVLECSDDEALRCDAYDALAAERRARMPKASTFDVRLEAAGPNLAQVVGVVMRVRRVCLPDAKRFVLEDVPAGNALVMTMVSDDEAVDAAQDLEAAGARVSLQRRGDAAWIDWRALHHSSNAT